MSYRAPVSEILFYLNEVLGADRLSNTEKFGEASPEMLAAIIEEAGKLAQDVIAPTNRSGDEHPARLEGSNCITSPSFADAYRAIAEGGWVGMMGDPEYGGMGLPLTAMIAVNEMISSACLSLALNPLLTIGQIEALENHADETLKSTYLPKLISGEWTGTMNLTESSAGSDVGALRSRAEPNSDGSYGISGQKIFISWGDHDVADNIIHLVLARLPDASPGTKGLSLFLVPKFLLDDNGEPGTRNAVNTVSIEHKMGLHGSPTCVLEFDRATGWLVGQPHGGIAAMFTMMNNARLGVAGQGVSQAEAALQAAATFATERKQGRTPVDEGIIGHADVRRMLGEMKAQTSVARAIMLDCAINLDLGRSLEEPAASRHAARGAFLTPIAKAFGTDTGCEVSAQGVQVHGGMGYIEETGAAQYYRDVRVTAIYEGTNGIQAMDLVGRKLADGGAAAYSLLADVGQTAALAETDFPDLGAFLAGAEATLTATTTWMLEQVDINARFAGAVPYLRAFALVLGGHYLLLAAIRSNDQDRIALARFFIRRMLPQSETLCAAAREGHAGVYALRTEAIVG